MGAGEERTIIALTWVLPPSSKEPDLWDWAAAEDAAPRESASRESWRLIIVKRRMETEGLEKAW